MVECEEACPPPELTPPTHTRTEKESDLRATVVKVHDGVNKRVEHNGNVNVTIIAGAGVEPVDLPKQDMAVQEATVRGARKANDCQLATETKAKTRTRDVLRCVHVFVVRITHARTRRMLAWW